MHAIAQFIETLVVAMAAAAFAHFGVTLKDAPCPKATLAVYRVPASMAQLPLADMDAPCPLARDAHRA